MGSAAHESPNPTPSSPASACRLTGITTLVRAGILFDLVVDSSLLSVGISHADDEPNVSKLNVDVCGLL